MRALRWAVALLFVLGLAACGPHKDADMPDVTGKRLDVAKNDIKQALRTRSRSSVAACSASSSTRTGKSAISRQPLDRRFRAPLN